MPYAMCPACSEDILLPDVPALGESVVCPACQTRLMVTQVHPLELSPAPTVDDELPTCGVRR